MILTISIFLFCHGIEPEQFLLNLNQLLQENVKLRNLENDHLLKVIIELQIFPVYLRQLLFLRLYQMNLLHF